MQTKGLTITDKSFRTAHAGCAGTCAAERVPALLDEAGVRITEDLLGKPQRVGRGSHPEECAPDDARKSLPHQRSCLRVLPVKEQAGGLGVLETTDSLRCPAASKRDDRGAAGLGLHWRNAEILLGSEDESLGPFASDPSAHLRADSRVPRRWGPPRLSRVTSPSHRRR